MQTVVLTGMMGSGKTTTGQILANCTGAEFIDLDLMIEKNQNCTISEIFATKGESYFRKIESKILMDIFNRQNQVISLGGGTFENTSTRNFLLKNSIVIYLETSPETIFERIKNDTSRPLLANGVTIEKIQKIIAKRKQNYETALYKISTDNKSPNQVVEKILGVLKND